jgi:hypothetical protein
VSYNDSNFYSIFTVIIIIIIIIIVVVVVIAIGLSPGGSSLTLVQTKIKINKTTITTKQLQNIIITQNNKRTTKE